eukprot:g15774.t1
MLANSDAKYFCRQIIVRDFHAAFDDWLDLDERRKDMVDMRRNTARAYRAACKAADLRRPRCEFIGPPPAEGEQQWSPDADLVPATLETVMHLVVKHQRLVLREAGKFGGGIEQKGMLRCPAVMRRLFSVPPIQKLRLGGKVTPMMQHLQSGCFVRKWPVVGMSQDVAVYFCWRATARRGVLIKCSVEEKPKPTPKPKARPKRGVVQQKAPAEPAAPPPEPEETYDINLANRLKTLSTWVLRPTITSSTKNFAFEVVEPGLVSWSWNGGAKCWRAKFSKNKWKKKTAPRAGLVDEKNRKALDQEIHPKPVNVPKDRTEREVQWKTVDMGAAVPERTKHDLLKMYYIFRPENGTWMAYLPMQLRRKIRGEGWTHDATKLFCKTTTLGTLDREAVRSARRLLITDLCTVKGIDVPEISVAEENASWQQIRQYIATTEKFAHYDESDSDSDPD